MFKITDGKTQIYMNEKPLKGGRIEGDFCLMSHVPRHHEVITADTVIRGTPESRLEVFVSRDSNQLLGPLRYLTPAYTHVLIQL